MMTLKQFGLTALAATFIAGGTTFAQAQSNTKLKGLDRADQAAGIHGQQGRDNAREKQMSAGSTVGASSSASARSNSGVNKLKGLNRADVVAGQHGAQGRANARVKNKNF